MNQLTSQDIPTINPPESIKTRLVPSTATIKNHTKSSYQYDLLGYEESALKIINNHSLPDEKWIRFGSSRHFISDKKRLINKGKLSTSIHVVVDRIKYTLNEMYLICHKGYDPDVHLVDWKETQLIPKYLDGEEWAPVKTRSGKTLYASNLGRIASKMNRLIRQHRNRGGYLRIAVDGVCDYVHRLVYQAFHPDTDISNYVVNHLDSVRDNNRLDNLESTSQSENMEYAYSYGYGAVMLGRISAPFVPDHKRVTSDWKF